jgi:DNA-binding NtrC family response regulator
VLLTGRRSFEAAVAALRLGAADVVAKRPDQVGYLKESVARACDLHRAAGDGDSALFEQTRAVLDGAFSTMLSLARQLYDGVAKASDHPKPLSILLAESDDRLVRELTAIAADRAWELVASPGGGAALDAATGRRFDVVLAREDLGDLPGSLVVKSVQGVHADAQAIVYTTGGEGHLDRYVRGQVTDVQRPFLGASQIAEVVGVLAQERIATERDRAVLRAFRADHQDFLHRYAELKIRFDRIHR